MCWISSGAQGVASVNPITATATAIFRQQSFDAPLLTISTTPSPLGSILYLPSVANYPYLPPDLNGELPSVAPITLTLYPIAISVTKSGAAMLLYPYCLWELDFQFFDGTSYPFVDGLVTVEQV